MSSAPAPAAETESPPESSKALVTVIVLCFGGLSSALVQTLVIPIQPQLPGLLDTSSTNASWVITTTLLAGAVGMPMAGRLADMFGKQRVLAVSSVLLLVGSLVCAQSDSLMPMLAGRALQGLAMGFIPVGISLMREVTPPAMTSMGIATMSATLGVGGAIGLPLAAWVAQDFDWHALFWLSGGLALIMLVGVLVLVPHVHDADGGSLDVVGALGLTVGLISTLVAISKGNGWGWDQPRTLGLLIGGFVVLVIWGWWELRVTDPLCDLRVSARGPVLLTNLAAVAIGFGMMAQSIVVPQLLQLPRQTGFGLGQSVLEAGLWLAPGGLTMMVFAPVSSKLMQRVGAERTLMLGATVLGVGYLVAALLMNSPWELLIASMVTCAGVGIGYAAMPSLILAAVPMREAASAVGINALMRSVGTTVAAAVMAMLLTGSTENFGGFEIPAESAFRLCFFVGAGAAFLGVVIVATIPLSRRATAGMAENADMSHGSSRIGPAPTSVSGLR